MEMEYREKSKKSYSVIRMTYNMTVRLFILGMGALMFLAERLKVTQITDSDPLFRYLFGGICLLYGGFRLYRGIKGEN